MMDSVIEWRPWRRRGRFFGLSVMVNIDRYGRFVRHNMLLRHFKTVDMVGFWLSRCPPLTTLVMELAKPTRIENTQAYY
jgi:hypothetical protein